MNLLKQKWLLIVILLAIVTVVVVNLAGSFLFGSRVSYPDTFEGTGSSGVSGQVLNPSLGRGLADIFNPSRPETITPLPPPSTQDEALDVDDRVYKKSSSYDVVAHDVAQYLERIKAHALSIGGRVLNSSLSSDVRNAYGSLRIKVPVDRFEDTNSTIVSEAKKVVREQVSAEDFTGPVTNVSDQIAALETQITDKEVELAAATDPAERQRLQRDLDRLKAQLEQLKNQSQKLTQEIDYAAVTVRVASSERYFNPSGRSDSLLEELQAAWESVADKLFVIAQLAIWVIVYSILWLPVVIVVRFLSRKFGSKA